MRKKFSVPLEKTFIFRFHIYFSSSFASNLVILHIDTYIFVCVCGCKLFIMQIYLHISASHLKNSNENIRWFSSIWETVQNGPKTSQNAPSRGTSNIFLSLVTAREISKHSCKLWSKFFKFLKTSRNISNIGCIMPQTEGYMLWSFS